MENGGVPRASVLVVENDEVTREALALLLEDQGYEVQKAENGAQALELLRDRRPEVILLDLHMPVLSGWDFLALRKKDTALAAIPVIIASVAEDDPAPLGAQGSVRKPYEFDELLRILSRYDSRAAAS